MSAKTKILVFRMREIIYTAIFAVLGIILLVLLFLMFLPAAKQSSSQEDASVPKYIAGVYTSPVSLNGSTIDVEVVVDETHINSIRLVNLSDTVATMYPLVSPTLDTIASQVCQNQSLENITYPSESKYTSEMLIDAISKALTLAEGDI
ncbi:MAG: hypothetical protein SO016_14130 [Lachnospiraceae bacterium]|nr:hypothetical protein [Robinsoniella sp.]MDY3767805.1 hypothetical protein [Lachnospiraceae bacterium]